MKITNYYFEKPLTNENPSHLVVFLHGYGANAVNLMSLSEEFYEDFPSFAFLAPDAPFPYEHGIGGFQWYGLMDRSEAKLVKGSQIAANILIEFLKKKLEELKLGIDKLILIGFSQGCMMSLFVAPRLNQACAAVIGLSGALIAPSLLPKETLSRPPICLIHGNRDDVVSCKESEIANKILNLNGFKSEVHIIPQLEHSINMKVVGIAKNFLKQTIKF